MDDDDKQENPKPGKEPANNAKPTFAEVVKANQAHATAELTLKQSSAAETVAKFEETETEKIHYLQAEAASAPKHLISHYAMQEENITRLLSAYTEQGQQQQQQSNAAANDQLFLGKTSTPLTDEPSCSRISTATTTPRVELQNKRAQQHNNMPTPSLPLPPIGSPQSALNAKELISLLSENIENQRQQNIFGLITDDAAAPTGANTGVTAIAPRPFTTVIAGTAVVIPTAIIASKPAESPTPPIEQSEIEAMNASSVPSIGSLVCRICHNSDNPERLVSPCLCKGSLSYVHIHCLERWISTSRSTVCELCQFQYKTEQTLRYTCIQSLRMWYSRSMSRRALQEDCQMFSLLTLVAFGIIGTLLVGIQYYFIQGRHWGLSSMWTKGWLLFFLFTTLIVYFINIYMIIRSQLAPWYRWWQSARDIKLILENRKPFRILHDWRASKTNTRQRAISEQQQQQQQQPTAAPPAISPPLPQPAAAALNSPPSMPQIPATPITPVMPASACTSMLTAAAAAAKAKAAMAMASKILPIHNKISSKCQAAVINISQAAAATEICGITTTSMSSSSSNAMAAGGLKALLPPPPPLQPHPNKLHISVELTTTADDAAQIIEIPLDYIDNEAAAAALAAAAAFEYGKPSMTTTKTTTITTTSMTKSTAITAAAASV